MNAELISWLTSRGGYVGPCAVREAPIRGLVTTTGVAAGEPLVAVPRDCAIRSTGMLEEGSGKKEQHRPAQSLILALIREHELGSESQYAPYINVLPKHVPLLRDWGHEQCVAVAVLR